MVPRSARILLLVASLALVFALGAQPAGAQDDSSDSDYTPSIDDRSSDFGLSFVPPDIQPSSDPADAGDTSTVGGTGGGLAVTGSDVEPIVAMSVGLLAVGGSALVSSRRRLRDLAS